jgi:hypothetical protein
MQQLAMGHHKMVKEKEGYLLLVQHAQHFPAQTEFSIYCFGVTAVCTWQTSRGPMWVPQTWLKSPHSFFAA